MSEKVVVCTESDHLRKYLNNFFLLSTFGFNVDELEMKLFSDENNVMHSPSCSYLVLGADLVGSVNVLNFYELLSQADSFEDDLSFIHNRNFNIINVKHGEDEVSYHSCFSFQSFMMGNGQENNTWRRRVEDLSNILLFDTTPIVNFKHFVSVSYAFNAFEEAVESLSRVFSSKPDAVFKEVLVVQKERLNTARKLLLNNFSSLIDEFKKLTVNPDYLNVLNTCSLTKKLVAPFSKFQFSFTPSSTFSFESKIFLNLIGFLFIDEDANFFVAPEVFMTLWKNIIEIESGMEVPSEEITVVNFNEFVETLTTLCFPLFISSLITSSSSERDAYFNAVEFKEVVTSASILAESV